jgi:hypothetical protein
MENRDAHGDERVQMAMTENGTTSGARRPVVAGGVRVRAKAARGPLPARIREIRVTLMRG